jgi:hypothetical protein
MRPRITWFIVGAVLVVGLLAGIDALRSSDEPPPASAERDRAVATTTREAIETIQVDLTERNSSGQSGTATVERNDDGTLNVTIELSGGSGEPQPAYIQRGRCSARFTDFELQSPIDELGSLPDASTGRRRANTSTFPSPPAAEQTTWSPSISPPPSSKPGLPAATSPRHPRRSCRPRTSHPRKGSRRTHCGEAAHEFGNTSPRLLRSASCQRRLSERG